MVDPDRQWYRHFEPVELSDGASGAALFTNQASEKTVLRDLALTNISGATRTVDLWYLPDDLAGGTKAVSNEYKIAHQIQIAATGVPLVLPLRQMTLQDEGDAIQAKADAANGVVAHGMGILEDGAATEARLFKRLWDPVYVDNGASGAALLALPTGKKYIVRSMLLVNISAVSRTVDIWYLPDDGSGSALGVANKYKLHHTVTLDAGGLPLWVPMSQITLQDVGDTIQAKASAASAVVSMGFGIEEDTTV